MGGMDQAPDEGLPAEDVLAGLEELLEIADAALDEEDQRREEARARRVRELEAEADRIDDALHEVEPRLRRAEELESADVLARLREAAGALVARREKIHGDLGYDPAQKRTRERAERSAALASELLESISHAQTATAAEAAVQAVLASLQDLTLDDAVRVLDGLAKQQGELPPRLRRLREEIDGFRDEEDAGERFRARAAEIGREQERLQRLNEECEAIEQEVGLLETQLGRYPKPAVRARIHELACRAKLLQQRHGRRISHEQHDRMRRMIFGRLHAIVKDTSCAFVPSLRQEWKPASFEKEIEEARAEFERATRQRPAAETAEPASEDLPESLRARLRQAEQWVLAEVYRYSNARYESPGDEAARKRLRRAARFATRFLDEHRDELARVLRHDADLFAEGSDFRWLRRRFARLDEEPPEEAGDETDDTGAIETLAGERVLHPSVMRALPLTRGRHVVMVGGAVRAERRDRLQELFEASEWEWVPYERGDGQRGVQQLATKVRNGSMDVVVCLVGFLGHGAFNQIVTAAREKGARCAIVPRGYGEAAIAEAILGTES